MTISFWSILMAALAYGLLHSYLASRKVKAKVRQWLGPVVDRWFRLVFNLIAILTLLPILLLPILIPDKAIYQIPFPWSLITLSIQGAAGVMLLIGLYQTGITSFIGLRQAFLPEERRTARLVTGGLYRYIRHPLYLAGLIIIWLTPVLTWNLLAMILGLTAYIFIGIHFEERKLLLDFGEAYATYRRRTPMLIPGIRRKQAPDKVS